MHIFDVLCVAVIMLLAAVPTYSIEVGSKRGEKRGRQTSRKCCRPRQFAERSIAKESIRYTINDQIVIEDTRMELTFITNGDFTYYRAVSDYFTNVGLRNQSTDFFLDTSRLCYSPRPRDNNADDLCLKEFLGYGRVRGKIYEVYTLPTELFGFPTMMRYYARRHDDGCQVEFAVAQVSNDDDYSVTCNSIVTYERMEFGVEQEALLQLPPLYEPCKDEWLGSFNATSNSTAYSD